uniref:Uncharacterized protein n=1 Tax=Acrobeloides nanus TaxID=290746 RepID=A0A914DXD3_9BILA
MDLAQKLVSCQDKPEIQRIVTDAKKNFANDYKKILSYIVENAPGDNKLIMTVGGNPKKNGRMTLVGEGNVNSFRLTVLTLMHGCYVMDEDSGEVIGIVTVQ